MNILTNSQQPTSLPTLESKPSKFLSKKLQAIKNIENHLKDIDEKCISFDMELMQLNDARIDKKLTLRLMHDDLDNMANRLGQISSKIEDFQNNVVFVNQFGRVNLNPIVYPKMGIYQQSIRQQIEHIIQTDAKQTPQSYNQALARKMFRMNRIVNQCIDFALQKL